MKENAEVLTLAKLVNYAVPVLIVGSFVMVLEMRLKLSDIEKDVSTSLALATSNAGRVAQLEIELARRENDHRWIDKFREANDWVDGKGDYRVKKE